MRSDVPFVFTMNILKTAPFLLLLALAACGSDNDGDDGGASSNNANSNFANPVSATHRLEFPRVKGGTSIVLVHTIDGGEVNYSVEWDTDKKSTRWSCYELYASNRKTGKLPNGQNVTRYTSSTDQYPQDPLLEEQYRWTVDPFRRSGYDHGHLCPSADRLNTQKANIQTFYLTNMMPQVNGFNAGVWANMEACVRNMITVSSTDTLFIVKGGTIDDGSQYTTMDRTGGKLIIPKYYYMALLMHNSSGYKAMGFWIEHKSSNDTDLAKYVVNIDELERLTGLDFFCNLPDDIENRVEGLDVENVKRAWRL